ncbi:MAG TPA: PQQ-dependent sugar dehydrogenase [Candidatus Limnocylindrales bacterium]|nr:PQQ-dependent sugar dehydrogenase [Candidatus Limnocylindrales bacterium]
MARGMRRRSMPALALVAIASLLLPAASVAAPTSARIRLALRASNLSEPVFVTSARDGTGRLFIVEQTGKIRIYKNGVVLSTPFLSIGSQVSKGSEQGLLGLAFSPGYSTNRKLYVNFTDLNGDTVIREYKASSTNPNVVATSTARTIMKIAQPYDNHNGGMLAFGPDGYLYIGTGDGGSGGDPGNRAQSKTTLLGKMLRINVNSSTSTRNYVVPSSNPYVGIAGWDEIWQLGLRNPWRFSFDRATGNLWIGDVGQDSWEEIDRAVKTSTGAGRGVNWGWHVLEGTHCYSPSTGCSTSGMTMPVAEYDHSGRCAVTGGYVYRGTGIPALVGGYVFADFCSGEIWVIDSTAARPATPTRLLDTSMTISSFGENQAGELYVLDRGAGKMYAILGG